MSKLSEEEIINNIKEIVELGKDEIEKEDENITVILDLEDLKSLQGMLDLYKKEKEKNKELLEGLKYRVKYCGLLERELYGNENIELTKIEQELLQEGDDK